MAEMRSGCLSNPQAHGSAVIKDVDREAFHPDDFGEAVDHLRKILERVSERIAGRQVRLTKARQIRRYQVKAVGEKWNQIAEHMPGGRKPMQQEQSRGIRPTGFAIGNLQTINIGSAVVDRLHENVPLQMTVVT